MRRNLLTMVQPRCNKRLTGLLGVTLLMTYNFKGETYRGNRDANNRGPRQGVEADSDYTTTSHAVPTHKQAAIPQSRRLLWQL